MAEQVCLWEFDVLAYWIPQCLGKGSAGARPEYCTFCGKRTRRVDEDREEDRCA